MAKFFESAIAILKNAWQEDFIRGIMVGIGCYLILVLLVHLIFIISRRRQKCTSFELPGEEGSIIVSIKAVTGVLQQELADFVQLEITRITVYQEKKEYLFEIRGKFLPGQSGTPALYTSVANAVKEKMNTIFGINNISKVDLRIDACKTEEPESERDLSFTPGAR